MTDYVNFYFDNYQFKTISFRNQSMESILHDKAHSCSAKENRFRNQEFVDFVKDKTLLDRYTIGKQLLDSNYYKLFEVKDLKDPKRLLMVKFSNYSNYI